MSSIRGQARGGASCTAREMERGGGGGGGGGGYYIIVLRLRSMYMYILISSLWVSFNFD